MKRRIHYSSECFGDQNYFSSKFVFPEDSTLLDIQYPLEGSPVKEKWWLQQGDILNTGWQLLANVRFLVTYYRQKTVYRNFTLCILKPTCYKTRRKESVCVGLTAGEAAVFLRAFC